MNTYTVRICLIIRPIRLVVQLARSMGLKVIASCGSNEKVDILRDLGVQHVINRRTDNIREILKKEGPIDIYFDNVGGEMLEAAIENAAMNSRFIICGSISSYNTDFEHAYGVRVSTLLVSDLPFTNSRNHCTEPLARKPLQNHVRPVIFIR